MPRRRGSRPARALGGRHREHPRHGTAKLPPITACPLEPTPRPFAPLNDRARQRMRAASTLDVTTGTTIDIPQSLRAAPARPALTFSLCKQPQRRHPQQHIRPAEVLALGRVLGPRGRRRAPSELLGPLAFWSPPSYPLPEYERAARQDFPRPNRCLLSAYRTRCFSSTRDLYLDRPESLPLPPTILRARLVAISLTRSPSLSSQTQSV